MGKRAVIPLEDRPEGIGSSLEVCNWGENRANSGCGGGQGSHWSWVRRIAIRLRKIVSTQWTVSVCFIFVCDHGIQAELGGRAKKQNQPIRYRHMKTAVAGHY